MARQAMQAREVTVQTADGCTLEASLYEAERPNGIVLHNGTLVADGNPADVIASPIVQEAYLGVIPDATDEREVPLPRPELRVVKGGGQ